MSGDRGWKCCLGCGRDTRGLFCPACRPRHGGDYPTNRDGERGRKRLSGMFPEQVFDCDDYGDESDADSVCDDNPEHPSGRWGDRRR